MRDFPNFLKMVKTDVIRIIFSLGMILLTIIRLIFVLVIQLLKSLGADLAFAANMR